MKNNNNANNNKAMTEKVVKNMATDINTVATATGINKEELLAKLAAELNIKFDVKSKVGDVKAEVPVLSNNTFNITISDVTVAERGGIVNDKKSKKKGDKKSKKKNKK